MNLYRRLTDLMKRESRAAAKITASAPSPAPTAKRANGFFTTPTPAKSSPPPPIWTSRILPCE